MNSALPADAHERTVASQILLNLQHVLGKKPTRTSEEQEFIVSMQNIVEKLVEKGRDQGRGEGQLAGVRLALRRVLTRRELVLSRTDEARIDACTDLATLERWLDQAMAAQSVAEALQGDAAKAAGPAVSRRRKSRSSS